ncbi:MAG TPA: hypothetical protein VJM34_16055 [Novosphingobium sp.]|nr:hypothetical protein [Novosphingobium sp.]
MAAPLAVWDSSAVHSIGSWSNLLQTAGFRSNCLLRRYGDRARRHIHLVRDSEAGPETWRLRVYDAADAMEVMMGGIGSGALRATNVGNVEDMLALDMRALRRLGVVRAGECICDTVCWSIGGLRASSLRLRVDLSDIERGGTMTISGDMPDGTIKQSIAIEGVPSSLGGWRCYFLCPVTGQRCEILYYAGGRFASRCAQRLSYAVQNMTDFSRMRRRAAKLRSRLQGSGNVPRSRGRNRIAIVERLHEAEFAAKSLYLDRLRNPTERSGAQRMPSPKYR